MIYKNEYENCIHFDGKECRNGASCNYGSYGEFCVDCEDVEGVDNMNKMNKLFDELWILSDDKEPMEKFVQATKTYAMYMKGNISIALIDLNDYGFGKNHLYISHDDHSGNGIKMDSAADFIEYYKEVLNQAPEIKPEEFWIPKLKKIILIDRD